MRALKGAWFSFRGVASWERGALMTSMPTRYAPALRGTLREVSGLSGAVFVTDGSYQDVEVQLAFTVPDIDNCPAVNAWLTGSGPLIFSDEPHLAYEARVIKNYKRMPVTPRLEGQEFTVVFSCKPFRLHVPAAPETAVANGGTLWNPGTAPARPRVTIRGSGDFSVTVNGGTVYFSGIEGGIVVDSALMDALSLDGAALLNDRMEGEPWQLQPGANAFSWETDGSSAVTGVTVLPRWRSL